LPVLAGEFYFSAGLAKRNRCSTTDDVRIHEGGKWLKQTWMF
jgi:hypothetical protein